MSVLVIAGYDDPEFDDVKDLFYANFVPDDWDYIILGVDQREVETMASRLEICDSETKLVRHAWMAVTYHS